MRRVGGFLTVAALTLLGGCGGADGAPGPILINDVLAAAALSYGKTATLNVTGIGLDRGITLSAPGCTGMQAGTTQVLAQSFTCKVTVPTGIEVSVFASTGELLATRALPVPDPQVTVVTSKGTFVLELNPAVVPVTVDNFLKYVGDGFYRNLLFHRVIPSFMIQGGGYSTGPVEKPATYPPIVLESNKGLSNLRGTVAMARTNAADSATAQFFVNVVDNLFLDYASAASPGYAVFGKVVSGLAVVDSIKDVPINTSPVNGLSDVPVTDVLITSATQTR